MKLHPTDPDFKEKIKDIVPLGEELYDTKIRALVEPKYANQYIAIHVDSGEYAVARTTAEASRALAKIRPDAPGRIMLRRIGDEPDHALIARLFAGEMMTRNNK